MLIYADGGALARAVTQEPESVAWRLLVDEREDDLVTSPLGLTELRRIADPLGPEARAAARDIAERVVVVRFSDQSLRSAAMTAGVASPFTAIHVGLAVAQPEVDTVATYDTMLARLAVIHGLNVLSPARRPGCWNR